MTAHIGIATATEMAWLAWETVEALELFLQRSAIVRRLG